MSDDKSTERIKVLAGIIIAVIGCVGSISAAVLPSILPRLIAAPAQADSSRTIVSGVQSPSMTPSRIAISPTAVASTVAASTVVPLSPTPTSSFTPTAKPTDTPTPKLYIFGYRPNDKPVKGAVDACRSCQVVYLDKLTDLPDDWRQQTFNAKTSKGVPDACRTKQDLIKMGYTAFMASTLKPCK